MYTIAINGQLTLYLGSIILGIIVILLVYVKCL